MRQWRRYLVIIFISFFTLAVFARLFFLQIINHQFYEALGSGQQKIFKEENSERGEIFLSKGEDLAINLTTEYIFASPKEIKKKEETAKILSGILAVDEGSVLEKLKKNNFFEVIKRNISAEEKEKLTTENLKGVYFGRERLRHYPQKELAGHICGFLAGDGEGKYGVEGYYDEMLRGEMRLREIEKGLFGYLGDLSTEDSKTDIVLTIDLNIQFAAEKELKKVAENLGIEAGYVLVMDPLTGKTLAMAQYPSFNPNNYPEVKDPSIFLNGLVQKTYEPGSVFKPITMAAAINEDKITPQTRYTDTGQVKIGGWTIENYDHRVWGERTMTEVLERSINTGAVFAQQQLGKKPFVDYIERFGFFEKTDIDLQGEIFSENLEFKKGYEVNYATASFGQGIQITPIQLACAYAAIANGGKLLKPYVVERYFKDGEETIVEPRIEKEGIISPDTASELTAMLVSVIENGFGKKAKIDGYFLAGKTGTALIPWPSLGISRSGYSDKTWQSFVGFGPAFNPKFLILIKLDNPRTKTAEYSALPIFRNLSEYIINYWQIPPDYESK